ncbi:hypothetical protein QP938_10350 [Porticoccaceae bacterium LTM1]|nr:hypothetical protein QP938_10350 [Porticoccaceae bacterium LTM1]
MFDQMKKAIIALFLVLSTGCSINHHVADGYGDYLVKNKSQQVIPYTGLSAEYKKTEAVKDHRYEFRALTVGYANLWIVEFGDILDETLKSQEIQSVFNGLVEAREIGEPENLIIFDLVDYSYQDYKANISIHIVLRQKGIEAINQTYKASGEGQTVQMWAAGVFGMMDAIRDSTKSAMDEIMVQLIRDIGLINTSSE